MCQTYFSEIKYSLSFEKQRLEPLGLEFSLNSNLNVLKKQKLLRSIFLFFPLGGAMILAMLFERLQIHYFGFILGTTFTATY